MALKTKSNLIRTTIFLTQDQHEQLRRIAFEKHTSMAKLIREACIEILEDEEDIQEGMKALADKEGSITFDQYVRERESRIT
jgi:hypothetical protein